MSKEQSDPQIEKLIKRLDLLIYLNLKKEAQSSKVDLRQQVLELYNFGIPTQDIANLLGKTRNAIDLHLTALRKEGKIILPKKGHEKTVEVPMQINSGDQSNE